MRKPLQESEDWIDRANRWHRRAVALGSAIKSHEPRIGGYDGDLYVECSCGGWENPSNIGYPSWADHVLTAAEEGSSKPPEPRCTACHQPEAHDYHRKRGRSWDVPYHPFYAPGSSKPPEPAG